MKPPIHGWAWSELRRRLPAPCRRGAPRGLPTARGLDALLAGSSPRPRRDPALLRARQRQRMGQLDGVRPRPGGRVSRFAAFLVLQLDELARLADEVAPDAAEGWRREGELLLGALMGELWTASGSSLARSPAGGSGARRACSRHCPSSRAIGSPTRWSSAWPRRSWTPHRVRPGDRTAELSPLRRRRVLARAHLGAVDDHRRGGPARRRPPRPGGRHQRAVPPPLRAQRLRRELRCAHRRGAARSRLHLDGERLPAARRPGIRAFDGDGGDGERVGWRNLAETMGMAGRDPSGDRGSRRASRMINP